MKPTMGRRLTEDEAREIKRELERHEFRAGEFRERLAERIGCGRSAVDDIAAGKTWAGIMAREGA